MSNHIFGRQAMHLYIRRLWVSQNCEAVQRVRSIADQGYDVDKKFYSSVTIEGFSCTSDQVCCTCD